MKVVRHRPNWKGHEPILPDVSTRPRSWQGLPVEWTRHDVPEPVFVEQFTLPAMGDAEESEVYLFGCRYELSAARLSGKSLTNGHFVEYLIVEVAASGLSRTYRLLQRQSVTFSETDEKRDYIPASEAAASAGELSVTTPPNWRISDAVWPCAGKQPMFFVGQTVLIENEVTRTLLTWDQAVFLFWLPGRERSRFKIVTQEVDFQSAEDHDAFAL